MTYNMYNVYKVDYRGAATPKMYPLVQLQCLGGQGSVP